VRLPAKEDQALGNSTGQGRRVRVGGHGFGGVRGAHGVSQIVEWLHGRQIQHLDEPDHPHTMPLEKNQRTPFELHALG